MLDPEITTLVVAPERGVALPTEQIAANFSRLAEKRERVRANRLSANTRRCYGSAFRRFAAWCEEHRVPSLPASPQTLSAYLLARMDSVAYATLSLDRDAIRWHHVEGGLESPTENKTFQEDLEGIRREKGVMPHPKAAATADIVKRMADACDETPIGVRDRAILLVLFSTGMRRSELAAQTWESVERLPNELRFLIEFSKTDQVGRGRIVRVSGERGGAYCPIAALEAWRRLVPNGGTGALFRSLSSRCLWAPLTAAYLAIVVKNAAERVGLDPTIFSGHSMRRGHVTSAARTGKTTKQIMAKTGHRSANTVEKYIEDNGELDAGMLGE